MLYTVLHAFDLKALLGFMTGKRLRRIIINNIVDFYAVRCSNWFWQQHIMFLVYINIKKYFQLGKILSFLKLHENIITMCSTGMIENENYYWLPSFSNHAMFVLSYSISHGVTSCVV